MGHGRIPARRARPRRVPGPGAAAPLGIYGVMVLVFGAVAVQVSKRGRRRRGEQIRSRHHRVLAGGPAEVPVGTVKGTQTSMRSRDAAPRIPCWHRWQTGKDPAAAGGSGRPGRPPSHRAKDFLGLAFTVTIIGAILLFATNALASQCRAEPHPRAGPGACSGLPAIADHIRGIGALCVLACAALAVIAFIWYMFRGYKTNGQVEGDRDA